MEILTNMDALQLSMVIFVTAIIVMVVAVIFFVDSPPITTKTLVDLIEFSNGDL